MKLFSARICRSLVILVAFLHRIAVWCAAAVDDADRVIVAFTDWQRGQKLAIAYSQNPRRDDWRLFDLPTENMGSWEASLDGNC